MRQNKTPQEQSRNKHRMKRYKQYTFRVRKGTEMHEALEMFINEGGTSLNFMITLALCEYLKCKVPAKKYITIKRKKLI